MTRPHTAPVLPLAELAQAARHERAIRRVARRVRRQGEPAVHLRRGVVEANRSGTIGTLLDVRFGDAVNGTLATDVQSVASGTPRVGDTVWCLHAGALLVAVGLQRSHTWTTLTLNSGWATNSGSSDLAYAVIDRVLWLRGVVQATTAKGAGSVIATLPGNAAPAVTYQTLRPAGPLPYDMRRIDVSASGDIGTGEATAWGERWVFDGFAGIPRW